MAGGAFPGPPPPAWRARLSGAYQSRHGFMDRVTPDGTRTGEHQGNMDRLSGRLVLEADLAPNLLATLSLDATRIREQSPAQVLMRVSEVDGFAGLYNAAVPDGVCLPEAGASRLTNPYCYNSQYARPITARSATNSGGNYSNTDSKRAALTLVWKLGDATIQRRLIISTISNRTSIKSSSARNCSSWATCSIRS